MQGDAANFGSAQLYQTDIQGIFDNDDNFLVASSSIPSYFGSRLNASDRSVTFSGTFLGEELLISPGTKHNLYSGDPVYYSVGITTEAYVDFRGKVNVREVKKQSLGAKRSAFNRPSVNAFVIETCPSTHPEVVNGVQEQIKLEIIM